MKAEEKAKLFIEVFGWGKISDSKVSHLTLDFKSKNRWLKPDEETFLRMLGAINIFAYTGWTAEDLVYTDNLNSACCGEGDFVFEDDEFSETFDLLPLFQLTLV